MQSITLHNTNVAKESLALTRSMTHFFLERSWRGDSGRISNASFPHSGLALSSREETQTLLPPWTRWVYGRREWLVSLTPPNSPGSALLTSPGP